MMGYLTTLESVLAMEPAFRRVLATGSHSQLVAMTLDPHEEIGAEVHDHGDQMFLVVAGWQVEITIGDEIHECSTGSVAVVPAGMRHNVLNRGDIPATVMTVYAPPEHADGTVALTRRDAEHGHSH